MSDLSEAALDYLLAGLHILALDGKKPNPKVHGEHWSWDDSFHGVPQLDEAALVAGAFDRSTGIAILIPEHFLVADVDTEEAAELLLELGWEANDATVAAKTKNGVHVWFYAPGADRNRWIGNRTLLFKGFGGYVVAPPSKHFDAAGNVDGEYSWARPLVEGGTLYLPEEIPPKVMAKFNEADSYRELTQGEKQQVSSFNLIPVEGVPWFQWEKVWDYQTAGLERAIETAADGNQNNIIHWAALTAKEEGVPFEVAMERRLAAAKRGNHPERRARDTIRGAYKRR